MLLHICVFTAKSGIPSISAEPIIKSSELNRVCGKIFFDHKSDLEDDSVVKFSKIKTCKLFDLLKSVNESVSVNEKLTGGFGNVQVIFKEALDSEKCFVVERFDRTLLEHFLKEGFAESCREVINKSCDTEVIIRNDDLIRIEHLSDFKSDLSFLE